MSVNNIEPIYENQGDVIVEGFSIMDGFSNFLKSKLPADISYFDHTKIEEVFRELDTKEDAKSEDYAYVLSSIIVNIGNAARQPSSLEKCYQKNIRYKRTVITYFNKYKNKLSVDSKKKIRHSIEGQFKHFEMNPIKAALRVIKIGDTSLMNMPVKLLKLSDGSRGANVTNGLVDTYSNWLAIKYYDLLEAVRIYKKAANQEYDYFDSKSLYVTKALHQEADYFYEVAYAVLEDMLKVYDQL